MAMEAEAAPVRLRLGLSAPTRLHPALPATCSRALVSGVPVRLVTAGVDERSGVDSIGTIPAAVTAWAASQQGTPRVLVSAGTAGGLDSAGARIGDLYLTHGPVVFHDRRIPLGGFARYGVGSFPSLDCTSLAAELGLKTAVFTSGDSLDLAPADERAMGSSGACVKDMESAAVAYVAHRLGVPFVGFRAITDLIDGPHHVADEFARNLAAASARLADAFPRVLGGLAAILPGRPG
jgi:5'-methylthioadenosine nucleosidase